MLLTIARDDCWPIYVQRDRRYPPWHKHYVYGNVVALSKEGDLFVPPINLSRYLNELVGKSLELAKDNDAHLGPCLLAFAKGCWLNFTHFVRLDDVLDTIPTSLLLDAWTRGFAIQCAPAQGSANILLVYYRGSLRQPLDAARLGVVAVKVRAGSNATEPPAPAHAPPIAGARARTDQQFLLIMDLDGTKRFPTNVESVEPCMAGLTHTAQDGWCIHIRGHGTHSYGILSDCRHPYFDWFSELLRTGARERVRAARAGDGCGGGRRATAL
ncbi:hypothetical protein BV25DRAFT_1827423 [Artomyces pyxidatus]|uniref:Uncharacterized protein n=1 Tax=Artomyces pyxidatus TaxID=48021 RepID=A0ACB8SY91_9AGAM|nr:hypothetical protein BV25DRAFT_1827423 [Artomyces pyxidatus]